MLLDSEHFSNFYSCNSFNHLKILNFHLNHTLIAIWYLRILLRLSINSFNIFENSLRKTWLFLIKLFKIMIQITKLLLYFGCIKSIYCWILSQLLRLSILSKNFFKIRMLFKKMKIICKFSIKRTIMFCLHFSLKQFKSTIINIHLIFIEYVTASSHYYNFVLLKMKNIYLLKIT